LAANGIPADAGTVLSLGFTPFIIGDLIKALLAGALLPLTWKLVNRKTS
jgi:biotin transport system substrate-specific component